MKKILKTFLLIQLITLLAVTGTLGAGRTTIFNETETKAYGLKVKFDRDISIIKTGDSFTSHSKKNEQTVVFSDGTVQSWGEFYFFWEPAEATIVSSQWLITPPSEETETPNPKGPEIVISLPNDKDGDGITDSKENSIGTDPNKLDTDGDRLSDYAEVTKYLTDPLKKDSDDDGEPDSNWEERREYTETIRIVGRVIEPYDLESMNNHFQDARKIKEDGNWLTYEAIIYIHSENQLNEASYPREDLPQDFLKKYTEKTTLFNYSDEMVAEIKNIIGSVSTDLEVVRQLLFWKRSNVGFVRYSGKVGVPMIYRFIVREDSIKVAPQSNWAEADWGESDSKLIKKNWLGDYMFKHRAHGSCGSWSVFLATMFRAAKIPTRVTYETNLWDRFRDKNVVKSIENKETREWILNHPGDEHYTVEVLIGNRWIRINGDYLSTVYAQQSGGPYLILGAYENFDSTLLGLSAQTVGSESVHWGDNPHHHYKSIELSYQEEEY